MDQLQPVTSQLSPEEVMGDIFREMDHDRLSAAAKVLGYLQRGPAAPLLDEARRLIFLKGTDSHDYKFSSAVLEDYYHVSPDWRDKYLATAVFQLRGAAAGNNTLVERTRAALAG